MIAQAISDINAQLPQGTRLVAVSKLHPAEALMQAYRAGQRAFGESRVQELLAKRKALPQDIEWHFIGHLQTNKVKQIAPFVALIHAVDSPRLLDEISRQGQAIGRVIPCLLELRVATEPTKYGFAPAELDSYLASRQWECLAGADIRGLMCIASNVDDTRQIEREFEEAHSFFLHARQAYFSHKADAFCECSWGMSSDYPLALRHGATLVRVGSRIFGERLPQ